MRLVLLATSLVLLFGTASADSLYVRLLGQCAIPEEAVAVAAAGGHAYVCGASGLHVISVADPANPVEVGLWGGGSARGVAVGGDYAYVAAHSDSALRVISIVDPTRPAEIGRCSMDGGPYAVVTGNGYAYVACGEAGICVIETADPTQPFEVGHWNVPGGGYAYNLAMDESCAYVAGGDAGLRVVSVADPTCPTEVGYYYAPSGAINAVAANGQYAYAAVRDSTFRVISVADPANPVEVGRCFYYHNWPTTAPQDMEVTRGYAFLATWWGGLRILDISNPVNPREVGHYDLGTSWSIALDGDFVFFTAHNKLHILQFYQLGDLDVDDDSLDVSNDTLRLRGWTTIPGDSLECVRGEFILANTSASYNPDSVDGPSVSPVESLGFTVSLSGPGGTLDSVVITNLPESLAQGQAMVCTLAVYVPVGLKCGDYSGSIYISGKDTANLQVYESCYVRLSKLGDIDVDTDSLDVVADTVRLPPSDSAGPVLGRFVLANTSASYNPDTADGPSLSWADSLRFTASLAGPGGTLDSVLIQGFPAALEKGQSVVCTLTVYVPDSLPVGDYAGSIVITGLDSVRYPLAETVYALVTKEAAPEQLGDLDIDSDSLDVVDDTMNVRVQPGGSPSGKARFLLVNTSSTYNPDAEDGPSRSPLMITGFDAYFCSPQDTVDSIYILNLPAYMEIGQAVECTLALVVPVGTPLDQYRGCVTINAYDTLGFRVRDSFRLGVRGPEYRQTLDSLGVAPIPFKPNHGLGHDAIHFQGLTEGARVVVYDASGQSVWTANEADKHEGHVAWDAKVASGIYVYLVIAEDGTSRVGKLSVIR